MPQERRGDLVAVTSEGMLAEAGSRLGTAVLERTVDLPVSLQPEIVFSGVAHVFDGQVGDYLPGRFTDGVSALLVAHMAGMAISGERADPEPETVAIDLEAARNDPKLILGMIQHAPLSGFHEQIVNTDLAEFEGRWERYHDEGLKGLWRSIREISHEELLAAHYSGRHKIGIRHDRRSAIPNLQRFATTDYYHKGRPIGLPDENTLEYILQLDKDVRRFHPDNQNGNRLVNSSMTQERLERYYAIRYGFAFAELGRHTHPRDLGVKLVSDLLGQDLEPSKEPPRGHKSPEWFKIEGMQHTLKVFWADRRKIQNYFKRSRRSGETERSLPISEEIINLEAIVARLTANAMRDEGDIDEAEFELLSTIVGMDIVQSDADRPIDTVGFLRLEQPEYTQTDFEQDIRAAATVRKLVNKEGNAHQTATFDLRMIKRIESLIAMRGDSAGRDYDQAVASVFSAEVLRDLDASQLSELAAQAMSQHNLVAGPGHEGDAQADAWLEDILSRRDAHTGDIAGRYAQRQARDRRRRGHEQRQEDFPGEGRMLTFYGDLSEREGRTGAIEAVSIATGAFDYLDSAGNRPPFQSEVLRRRVERFAAEIGHPIEISTPFPVLPSDYLCEMAHFFGRLFKGMHAEDVLRPVIDNGIATLSYEDNLKNGVIAELMKLQQLGEQYPDNDTIRHFDVARIPTDRVRFIDTEDGLQFVIGHADPEWRWQDHTLVVFMRGPKNKPNPLFQSLAKSIAAAESDEKPAIEE